MTTSTKTHPVVVPVSQLTDGMLKRSTLGAQGLVLARYINEPGEIGTKGEGGGENEGRERCRRG